MQSYWQDVMQKRLSRRRPLAATGAGALGAAFLAACGGDDDDGGGEESTVGLITSAADSSNSAVRGGVWKANRDREVDTSDPHFVSRAQPGTAFVYSKMFRQEPGYLAPSRRPSSATSPTPGSSAATASR